MASPRRSYITTPIEDTDLRNFKGRIEQYDVFVAPQRLDAFMRHCVSNRLAHELPVSPLAGAEDESPNCDILRISGYQMFDSSDEIVVHPLDEIAMDDLTVRLPHASEPSKVVYITNFLGPEANAPLLFIWRPMIERLGLYLPHLPSTPDQVDKQEDDPLIDWAQVLGLLQNGRQIAQRPGRTWAAGDEAQDFSLVFQMLVMFFRGRRVDEGERDEYADPK